WSRIVVSGWGLTGFPSFAIWMYLSENIFLKVKKFKVIHHALPPRSMCRSIQSIQVGWQIRLYLRPLRGWTMGPPFPGLPAVQNAPGRKTGGPPEGGRRYRP